MCRKEQQDENEEMITEPLHDRSLVLAVRGRKDRM
jgi:hypothetical protein